VSRPETLYATTGDGVNIAYQVFGEGPPDLVFSPDWLTHAELFWEHPRVAAALRDVSALGRLIMFDKRGIGLSDRVPVGEVPSLETWVDDLRAVLDAAGSERATLFGMGQGAQLALSFAATFPERTSALVLLNAYARLAAADDYPFGYPPAAQRYVIDRLREEWGRTGWVVQFLIPSEPPESSLRKWFQQVERLACTPATGAVLQASTFEHDVRHVLPTISVPTLVMHSARSQHVVVDHGRYLAEHIQGARYVEIDSDDQWVTMGPAAGQVLREVARFLGATPPDTGVHRVLATLMFTDVVESTPLLERHGDRNWRVVLDQLDTIVEKHAADFGGRVVSSTGDGHLLVFDGAGRAIRCAEALIEAAASAGLRLRAGLHAGEVELRGDNVTGIAVHVAERVSGLAAAGEVLVSSTVHDLVDGSGLRFDDRGRLELKGVSGPRQIYAIVG
jgi:class 3 adenylate cyclase/alpha-beta hydrolase superfamily lysophospholipase